MQNFKLIRLGSRTHSRTTDRPVVARHMDTADEEPSRRERQVEDLLCRGYSQENVAAIFGRSVNTISAHKLSLCRKRRVHTQVGLLSAYLERRGIFVFNDEGTERASGRRVSLEMAQ
jgi:DNA-binding CsgD family transcriptional regulator